MSYNLAVYNLLVEVSNVFSLTFLTIWPADPCHLSQNKRAMGLNYFKWLVHRLWYEVFTRSPTPSLDIQLRCNTAYGPHLSESLLTELCLSLQTAVTDARWFTLCHCSPASSAVSQTHTPAHPSLMYLQKNLCHLSLLKEWTQMLQFRRNTWLIVISVTFLKNFVSANKFCLLASSIPRWMRTLLFFLLTPSWIFHSAGERERVQDCERKT